ncbi:hypothetical protein G419_11192 [Rhodococcus triatomae BKS 15-14]|nr:hypothetical protein G419_11192 [Rhodococcus triatomae BKS 15-14]
MDVGQPLDVDTGALRVLAALLSEEADRVDGLEPSAAVESAATAMPASSLGAAAARAAAPLLRSYRARACAIHDMAAVARANASDYDTADSTVHHLVVTAGGDV